MHSAFAVAVGIGSPPPLDGGREGAIEQRRGSLILDARGTPTMRKFYQDGVLQGYLQDRLTRADGHAADRQRSRESFAPADAGMTNTFMLAARRPAELITRVKDGIRQELWVAAVDITRQFRLLLPEAYRSRRHIAPRSRARR